MDTSETYKRLSDEASPLGPDYVVERVKWYEDPVYIKMCDCEEIQDGHKWVDGDYFFEARVGYTQMWCDQCLAYLTDKRKIKSTWLPRQDQLQEMLLEEYGLGYLLHRFVDWWDNMKDIEYPSMKQLWLAFVMKERFGKVWSGTEWIK